MIVLIYIAAVGSLMISYAKARAEGLGLECKTGLLARPERVVILAIGLLTGTVAWALVLLAIFSHVTVIERIAYVRRVSRQPVVLLDEKESSTNNRLLPTSVGANEVREPSVRPVPTGVPPFTGGGHQE
jgi:CDP-diacylglycerol--glycerol-3-phosphate 3-phosphatidyltransferase